MEWRPFELHPEIPPQGTTLPPQVQARLGHTSAWLQEQARQAGLEMVMPEVIPNSRRALEASEYARQQGRHEAFHQVVFRKFFGEGQDLSDWAVLRAAAEEVGLDPEAMQSETGSGKYRAVVDGHIRQARTMGITGVPVFIFDNRYAIVGAQPYEVFQEAMGRLTGEVEPT